MPWFPGIKSFKIEGRMKRPEYVGEVVKAYRQAIDYYFDQKNYTPNILQMKKVFNRGFTQGFLFQDYLNLAQDIPGNQGIKIGTFSIVHRSIGDNKYFCFLIILLSSNKEYGNLHG